MATGAQASGAGVMVSRPFNWRTVALLMATKAMPLSRADLDAAAGFTHSLQSYSPKVTMGTLSWAEVSSCSD